MIIGPDPIPTVNPRPGWYAQQNGVTPTFSVTEILEGPTVAVPPASPWLTDGNGNVLTDGNGNPLIGGGIV